MRNKNFILNTDSYKLSQFSQYPAGTEYVYSYIESRGGRWDRTVFFGLQAFLREYMSQPITQDQITFAKNFAQAHGEPFNEAGWQYILDTYQGRLPLLIKAAPEGAVIPTGNVLVTIVNTDPACYWLTSYAETAILRGVWYPTTVATNSFMSRRIILDALERTGDPSLINFKLHDFGARGVSSEESATLGGMAHLVNFQGTDTISGILGAIEYYDADVCGFSIPAMEHSTVTSWGRENEVEAYRNMLNQYARPGALIAAVSDSYDIYEACRLWGTELRQQIIDSGAMVVIRPDSGDPASVVTRCARILDEHFGHTVNSKGYRVLNNVRIIQGDGINDVSIRGILLSLEMAGYSADNVAFGQGGALLQQIDRDTLKFAMKCSAVRVNGEWRDVYKDPVTDTGKRSKRGRLALTKNDAGEYVTVRKDASVNDILVTVFDRGQIMNSTTFEEVRGRASRG
jgi:nicotinamide phosphoribosyltransferase